MVSYVRYVFANEAAEDREVAERVISNFLQKHESGKKKIQQSNQGTPESTGTGQSL